MAGCFYRVIVLELTYFIGMQLCYRVSNFNTVCAKTFGKDEGLMACPVFWCAMPGNENNLEIMKTVRNAYSRRDGLRLSNFKKSDCNAACQTWLVKVCKGYAGLWSLILQQMLKLPPEMSNCSCFNSMQYLIVWNSTECHGFRYFLFILFCCIAHQRTVRAIKFSSFINVLLQTVLKSNNL